jgi:hypothetical protein
MSEFAGRPNHLEAPDAYQNSVALGGWPLIELGCQYDDCVVVSGLQRLTAATYHKSRILLEKLGSAHGNQGSMKGPRTLGRVGIRWEKLHRFADRDRRPIP